MVRGDNVYVQLIGFAAGFLSIAAFAPHAWTVYKKDAGSKKPDLKSYFVFAMSLLTWSVYGSLRGDAALIVSNLIQLAVITCIFFNIVCARGAPKAQHVELPTLSTTDDMFFDEKS
jgi:uncharacterized protein with PQ loop repeat